MAHIELPPMIGDPARKYPSTFFASKRGKHGSARRLAASGMMSLSGGGSKLSRSASATALVKPLLPPIVKGKPLVSFDDIYAEARLRVAKKAAVERQGGCASHLVQGGLPSYPGGLSGSSWMTASYRDFLPREDPAAQQWAASVMDMVQGEQASMAEEQSENLSNSGPAQSNENTPHHRRGSNEALAATRSRRTFATTMSTHISDDRPETGDSASALSRFRKAKTALDMPALVDPGLLDLLEALSARYEGRAEGLSEGEVQRLEQAFNRFKIPGEADLYTGDLQGLLNYLGHVLTTDEIIQPVLREITMYDYMDFEEFLCFMEKFYERERAEFEAKFNEFDTEGRGEVSVRELRQVMRALGFHPLRQMTEEAIQIVDDNGNGQLSFDELCMFLAVYSYHEGFTTAETEELRKQFERFAVEGQGPAKDQTMLPPEALSDALVQAFGLEVSEFTQHLGEQLASGAGLQKSTFDRGEGEPEYMNFSEFLIFARKVRENEYSKCHQEHVRFADQVARNSQSSKEATEFADADLDNSGGISDRELRRVLKNKKYTPLRNVLEEILDEVYDGDWDEETSELDFDEFFDFMLVFNRRDGFTAKECEELRKTYDRFDEDQSGEISAMEIAALFRHVGYRVNLEDIRDEVAQVDANGSGQLDFREFLRLMRLYREKELRKVRKAFLNNKDQSTDLIPLKLLEPVLKSLGHEPPFPHEIDTDISFDELVDLVDSCRSAFVWKERKKAGFSDEELAGFVDIFKRFDRDKSETIDNRELQNVLKEYNWEPRTREDQQNLIKKLDTARRLAREAGVEDVGPEGSPDVKFWAFVQLIRIFTTDRDKAEEEEVLRVQKELNFSEGETEEFRQVFRVWIKKSRELSGDKSHSKTSAGQETLTRDGVDRLVRSLGVSIAPYNKDLLDKKVASLDDEGRTETARINFCAFLKLMRWMLDTNFAGVNEAASGK